MKRMIVIVVLLVAGCGSPTPTAGPSTIKVSDLVGDWRVAAPGEPQAVLRLTSRQVLLSRGCDVEGGWVALATGQFSAMIDSSSGPCTPSPKPVTGAPAWLLGAARVQAQGDGWALLDAGGAVVATLTRGTMPKSATNLVANEPFKLTDAERVRLDRVAPVLPAGTKPATAADLAGKWIPRPAARPFAEFGADARYTGSDGCNGLSAHWITDGAGAVAVTGGVSTAIGCENLELPSWFEGSRVARDGDALVIYDAGGHEVHRLIKG